MKLLQQTASIPDLHHTTKCFIITFELVGSYRTFELNLVDMKYYKLTLILFFFFSSIAIAQAQDELEVDSTIHIHSSSYLLKAFHQEKNRVIFLSTHENVSVVLKETPNTVLKGVVEHIDGDVIIVSGETIPISNIATIYSNGAKKELHVTNLLLSTAGGITTTAGVTLLTVGETVATIVGLGSLAIGIPILYVGLTKYFSTNKVNTAKGWVIEPIQLGGFAPKLSTD